MPHAIVLSCHVQNLLPQGTPIETIDKLFRTKIRNELFNRNRALNLVLKRPSSKSTYLGKGELYNIFSGLNIMCTQVSHQEGQAQDQQGERTNQGHCHDQGQGHDQEFWLVLVRVEGPGG